MTFLTDSRLGHAGGMGGSFSTDSGMLVELSSPLLDSLQQKREEKRGKESQYLEKGNLVCFPPFPARGRRVNKIPIEFTEVSVNWRLQRESEKWKEQERELELELEQQQGVTSVADQVTGHATALSPPPNSTTTNNPNNSTSNGATPSASSSFKTSGPRSAAEKPKKLPRTRPKLTPDLLLSDDGLGYVLRYFPRAFKYHGRRHEVRDLGNLLQLYSEWHSRLIPYYSFNQFIHKVEKVAATRRVKTCLRELRERVANGGDPTKLREPPVVHDIPADEQEDGEASHQERDMFAEPENVNDIQEDILNDIYDKATEEHSQPTHNVISVSTDPKSSAVEKTSNEVPNNGASQSSNAEVTAEQRARMEANRLKALERRAARAGSSQTS